MPSKDYIPRKDEDFDILQTNVYTTSSNNASKWSIASTQFSLLSTPRQRWTTAYAAYKNPITRTPGITQEKSDARSAYEPVLRLFIQGQLTHNALVTDGDLRSMGLPVYDRTPTEAKVPDTRPELEVMFPQIMQHSLKVRDSESKGSGKPPHVMGYEIWRRIGGETNPTYDDMQFVGLATRSPHVLVYTSVERKQTIWYALRWVNTRGEVGPWSEIVSATVP
jgi:hypothetical protein